MRTTRSSRCPPTSRRSARRKSHRSDAGDRMTTDRLSPTRRRRRDPLLQFLAAGFLLFAGYRALNPMNHGAGQGRRIELTDDDLRQLTIAWVAQGRPAPTPDEMAGLVESRVRE